VVAEAEDSMAGVAEVEDSAGAEDFPVGMGLAAAEDFVVVAAGSPAGVPSAVALAGVHFAAVAAISDVVTAASEGAAGTDVDTGAATASYSALATDTRIIIPTITTLIPILITLTHIPTATIHTPTIPMLMAIPVTATIRMANMEARKRGL